MKVVSGEVPHTKGSTSFLDQAKKTESNRNYRSSSFVFFMKHGAFFFLERADFDDTTGSRESDFFPRPSPRDYDELGGLCQFYVYPHSKNGRNELGNSFDERAGDFSPFSKTPLSSVAQSVALSS